MMALTRVRSGKVLMVAAAFAAFTGLGAGAALTAGDSAATIDQAAYRATDGSPTLVAKHGADDPAGDDRGGKGRRHGADDHGGRIAKGSKGRGGADDGPNHT